MKFDRKFENFRPWELQAGFYVAVQTNNIFKVENLLSNGVDADSCFRQGNHDKPALCLAVERGHIELAQILMRYGCSVNQGDSLGRSALHYACTNLYGSLATILIKNGADPNKFDNNGDTPLHIAAKCGEAGLCQCLLEAGGEADKQNSLGETALLLACYSGLSDVVRHIMSGPGGRDQVMVSDVHGTSPWLAVGCCSPGVVREMIELVTRHSDVNRRNSAGYNALHMTLLVAPHNTAQARALLLAGVDPNARNDLGQTPLYIAVRTGQWSLVADMLAEGGDLNVPDKLLGKRPVDLWRDMAAKDSMARTAYIDTVTSRHVPSLSVLTRRVLRRTLQESVGWRVSRHVAAQLPLPTSLQHFVTSAVN